MLWGNPFHLVHVITLILAVLMITGLYFILKNKSEKTKVTVLGILSFSGIAAIIFNLVKWNSPLEYLPLHLCSFNAILLPIAVFTKNKILNNLLLLWSLGALFAIVVNTSQANFEIFSLTFVFYYFPHVLEFGIPILIFLFKIARRDVKCIISTVTITLIIYTITHFLNLALNDYFVSNNVVDYNGTLLHVNYMYSIAPENPLLSAMFKILPYSYFYMLLVIPMVVLYLTGVYFDLIFIKRKKNA